MKGRILLVEDEPAIADSIVYALSKDGWQHLWVSTGTEALVRIKNEGFHLVVMDLGLPDIDGFELLMQLRHQHRVPVLVLTARAEEVDKVLGLEMGADDYMTKPFSPRELVARIKAILRRSGESSGQNETNGSSIIRIDEKKKIAFYQDKSLALSPYEFKILCLLVGKPGWVFSREQIMDLVWDEPEESFDRTVDAHIKNLRAKLRESGASDDIIETRRGHGYSFKEI